MLRRPMNPECLARGEGGKRDPDLMFPPTVDNSSYVVDCCCRGSAAAAHPKECSFLTFTGPPMLLLMQPDIRSNTGGLVIPSFKLWARVVVPAAPACDGACGSCPPAAFLVAADGRMGVLLPSLIFLNFLQFCTHLKLDE